ncbi:MAG TPA: protein kinase [Pyrinomonadaceae bacterium]|jgi:serine/threonine protein kinase/Flp pilus assembly protein TadD
MFEGQIIGHYRILARLGEGGMGVVYKAEDTRLGRLVALKFPTPGADRQAFRARFLQEARAISALNHPHIATVHDFGETAEGDPFIVMELVGGRDVSELLSEGALTLGAAVGLMVEVVGALAAAHRHGIVHRDIKPGNVRVNDEGQVKVLDFGLSKEVSGFRASTDATTLQPPPLTSPGVVVGTPHYLSPEQARAADVDARSDIFALGALLYECITGRPAFAGASVIEIGAQVLHVDPPPPSQFNPHVPPELDEIALKALAKDPAERYQTAAEMQADLEAVRDVLGAAAAELIVPSEWPTAVPNTTRASARRTTTKLRSRRRKLWPALVVGALVAAVAALGVYLYLRRDAAGSVNALAVLPFENAAGNPELKYLSDGLTESLINTLSQQLPLKVMARSAVFRYEGRQLEPRQIGRELGVGAVLTGSVMARGDALAVSVELIDARDNTHIWGAHYDRPMTDVLAVQDEIARETAAHLRARIQMSAAQPLPAPKRYTDNTEAYQAYLRGRYFWNRRTAEGLRKAIDSFNEAIRADPNYALAYAGIADSYALLSDHSVLPPRDAMPKAKAAAERALAIDPQLAEGLTSRAFVEMAYDWRWAQAEEDYRRAIALNPSYATTHQWYSSCLVQMNRFPEALAEIRRAQELDPLSLIINANSGLYLYYSGPTHYEEAAREVRKALEVDDSFGVAHLYLGYIYQQQPARRADALAELQRATALMGDDAETWAALGHAYAASGKTAEARKVLERLRASHPGGYVSPYFIALVYAGLGDHDRALAALYQAYKDRHPGMIFMRLDPRFAPLRTDSRFADLQRHVEQASWDELPSLEELLKRIATK